MTSPKSKPSASAVASRESKPYLPALVALFVASGACALIYEVVWFQLLELVIGSSAISLGVLLATFMGGMCIGSLALPRVVPAGQHPLRVYALLELGIGVMGLLVLFAVPLVSGVYMLSAGPGFGALVLRAVICAVCLLPPTVLMGATLPAAARWLETSPKGVLWMGFLYGGNTIGAVFGSVLAGFYLLRVYDLTIATVVAVMLNATIGGVAWWLSRRVGTEPRLVDTGDAASEEPRMRHSWVIYASIGLSGTAALGAEVVWTRLLSLMLGATTYTFSMILGVFLTGLGVGSAAGSWLGRRARRPALVLGVCQLLQLLGIAWAALLIAKALPFWPINPSLATSAWFTFQLDLTRTIWAVLPAALLWGASFPLALAAASARGQDPARLVSGVYAANTVGAIVGALGFSLIVVPMVGTQHAQQVLLGLSALSAALVFGSLLAARRESEGATSGSDIDMAHARLRRPRLRQSAATGSPSSGSASRGPVLALLATVVLALITIATTPAVPGLLVAYGRYMVTWLGQAHVEYVGEGMNSSVAVTTLTADGATQFHVSGKVEASTLPQDMRLQRMLAHLPALVHRDPRSVLVVGFGAGVTAGSFVPYPGLERLTICEIEPLIPKIVSKYFTRANNDVLNDKRTHVFYDDARSFILTTKEKYDIITSDPIHPWVKGAASLYTREYFEAVKAHLNPGGVVSQWVPLYESTLEAVKSEIATFLEVFPNGTVWANNMNAQGYDIVLLAQEGDGPARIDVNAMRNRFMDQRYQLVASSLEQVGFDSPTTLFATYAGEGKELAPWLKDATINRDRNLRLQYLAATGLNQYKSREIYDEMVKYRSFPESLFVADSSWKNQLRAAIGR